MLIKGILTSDVQNFAVRTSRIFYSYGLSRLFYEGKLSFGSNTCRKTFEDITSKDLLRCGNANTIKIVFL